MKKTVLTPDFFTLILGATLLLAGCAGHQPGPASERVSQREVEIRLDLVEAHLRNKEPRLALQELNIIQSQAQNLPRFHFTLGYVRLMLGNARSAEEAFRKAVELDPDHAEAWNNLGLALLSIGQPDEAEHAFAAALAIPTYRTPEVAALNLAQLYLDRDRQDMALHHVNHALELNWRFGRAHLLAAEIELAQGRTEQAIRILKRGAEANLDNPQIMFALAEYLLLAGRSDQAIPWLNRLQETAPDSAEAQRAAEYLNSLDGWDAAFMGQDGLVFEQDIQEPAPPVSIHQSPATETSPPLPADSDDTSPAPVLPDAPLPDQVEAVLVSEKQETEAEASLPARPVHTTFANPLPDQDISSTAHEKPEPEAAASKPESPVSPIASEAASPGPSYILEQHWDYAYIVQIGAFQAPFRAQRLMEAYRTKAYPAQIAMIEHKGRTWHLVFIAASQNRDEAVRIAQLFRVSEGKDVLVVKIGQGRYLDD